MVDIDKLTASIKLHEGLRSFPYADTTGHTTIGYGHNLSSTGISNATADFILSEDIAVSQKHCEDEIWWPNVAGDDVRSRALIELVFNVGIGGLHTFVQAVSYLAAGDFVNAAREFEDSKWYDQTGNRAKTLVAMIRTGQDP